MKVVGKSEDGYLIAASEREICQIFGFSSEYDDGWKKHLDNEHRRTGGLIGMQIHPASAYNQLAWIRRRNSEFTSLVNKLRDTADHIEAKRPLFTAVVGDDADTA